MDSIQFLQELLRVNSSNPPGNEHEVTDVFIKRCKDKGIPYKITFLDENRSNFEVTLKGKGDKHLFLCGHMDTVSPGEIQWTYAPFSGELVGDKIYGRGAADMKSGLAAMYLALEALYLEKRVPQATVTFLATAGEEVDSCGARVFLDGNDHRTIDALIIGEPTNEKVAVGHKGALWLEIVAYGKTAHGSMPEQGINAIDHMIQIVRVLESIKIDWKLEKEPLGNSSVAVTMIDGGIQTNVIPDRCSIRVDIRTVPPQSHDELIQELNDRLNRLVEENMLHQFKITKVLDRAPVLTPASSEIIQCALTLKEQKNSDCYGVSYYTDAAVLNPRSEIPTLIYGPGDEKLAHQPNEWVSVSAYKRAIQFYQSLILSYDVKQSDQTTSTHGGVK